MSGPARIGFSSCAALVVANMVGTGVFTSLGFQVAEIPSASAIMLLWLLGGILALCGALCYAELASALPRSGGEYNFLGQIYHPAAGFMAGIVSIVVGFAAPVALSAMAFGSYLHGVFPRLAPQASAVAAVIIVTLVHLRSLRTSSIFQISFTMLKVALVIFLSLALLGAAPADAAPAGGWSSYVFTGPFAVSLMYTLYAYSGWNAATYVLGEVKNPGRSVPLALAAGTILVTVLYLSLNYAFLRSTPAGKLAGEMNVAQIAAESAFGPAGGRAVAALIALGLISALSAMVWAGPRVAMVLAEDHPRLLGALAKRNAAGIPARAVIAQGALATALLLSSTFEHVLVYAQFALLACGFLTVAGVFVLRRRQPDLPRPFRVPLYPLTPLLFMAISGFAMVYTFLSRPLEAGCGILTLLASLGVYFVATRTAKESRP